MCLRFWGGLVGSVKARRQSPSGLASSASSPLRGEPFCAGSAREKGASFVGRPALWPPRRGQDPSLQCNLKRGAVKRERVACANLRAGPARPLPRGVSYLPRPAAQGVTHSLPKHLDLRSGHARGSLCFLTPAHGGEASHLYIMSYSIGVSNSRAAFSRSPVWPSAHISLTATASGVMSRASRTPGSSPTARPTS